jgi:4a-hydroxytetrahydrobiopterin dehydratase
VEDAMKLAEQKCEPCTIGTPPLSRDQAEELLRETPRWTLKEDAIEREFTFADFRGSVDFVNRVAEVAEGEGHHPDIFIYYNTVRLHLTTHKIKGLSRNDFVLASKIDGLV